MSRAENSLASSFGDSNRSHSQMKMIGAEFWLVIFKRSFSILKWRIVFDVAHYLRQEVGYTGPIYAITGFLSEQLTTKELATFDALFTKPMVSHTAEIDTILATPI